ncbi:MAG: hypothetical protein M1822_009063 [Bathelium mastoideum]|nr:MAG: hypothetical protein M1822_009063 [Bathelium mastoideum]
MARQVRPVDFTVVWVSALPVELAAAQEMLDEQYDDLPQASDDAPIYTYGRIGQHNVVLVCLPAGQTGTNPAAGVVIKEDDIRLGDIVVSQPNKGHGGVIQYDFGKSTPSGFERTGFLNSPPRILLNAIVKLRANHD